MDVSKMSLEALQLYREELIYCIDSHKKDLAVFPGNSPLGRRYLKWRIKDRQKVLDRVIEEIEKRININKM